ncbi:GNAT family N-acetyltransferase [Nonomuraea maritima]|uniref:GNAT family N-acetyltransferase n=1 Tax=Nonomuraea maritima TaxID=683260 RepID=UPI00370FF592
MSPIAIRPAAVADAPVLAELNAIVHTLHVEARPDVFRSPSDGEQLAAIFADFLARDDSLAFVAEDQDVPVGYVTATVHRRTGGPMHQSRAFVYVDQIAVRHSRGGVGTALVEAVCAAGRQAGCTDVVTEVWEFNERARSFFGNGLGFTPMRHILERPL